MLTDTLKNNSLQLQENTSTQKVQLHWNECNLTHFQQQLLIVIAAQQMHTDGISMTLFNVTAWLISKLSF